MNHLAEIDDGKGEKCSFFGEFYFNFYRFNASKLEINNMNLSKTVILITFSALSTSVFAQEREPVILEVKKKTDREAGSDKKENVKYFHQFGLMPGNHDDFKAKYGVTIFYENCVATPFLSDRAKKHNLEVAQYLTQKYGEIWKEDLGFLPYGL